jgi:small subunit ribosomal protein S2
MCSKVADACIEGHDLAEERLRAETKLREEQEMAESEGGEPDEDKQDGPEVIVISKKEEMIAGEQSE